MIIMIMIIMPGSGVAHLYSQNWEVSFVSDLGVCGAGDQVSQRNA